jgi:hypothetical protein
METKTKDKKENFDIYLDSFRPGTVSLMLSKKERKGY